MKRNTAELILCALITLLLGVSFVSAQGTKDAENGAKNTAGKGVSFEAPKGFHTGPLAGFKGVTMLNLERPAGIFVTYPDENESIEDLSARVLPALARMFVHDDEAAKSLDWASTKIPSHEGEMENSATLNVAQDSDMTVQVAVYQREWNGLNFIYGYFAKKDNTDAKIKDFLDSEGKGVWQFEKFWKTFPKK